MSFESNRLTARRLARVAVAAVALSSLSALVVASPPVSFEDPILVSTTLGGAASKGKIERVVYPNGNGGFVKALVVVYADAAGPDVWTFDGTPEPAADLFAVRSIDDGRTWSEPVNLSRSANLFSASADHDGLAETPPRPYWGHSDKPNLAAQGKNLVVTWVDHYAPTGVQRTVRYPQFDGVEVPYAATYAVRSTDGGATWSDPELLSDGSRDAKQDVSRGSSAGWVVTWQEDPQGLQPGEAEGPGEGGSGANVTKGTDIWWTALPLGSLVAGTPFPPGQRLTDNFTQMGSGTNEGYESGTTGASRANLGLVGNLAIVAYEETKGSEGTDFGKVVRYHVFSPFDASMPDATAGAGWIISDPRENARRVRFFQQAAPGTGSGVQFVIFFKQGLYDQGGPSDIILRRGIGGFLPEHLDPPVAPDPTTREAALANTPGLNMSSSLGLAAGTDDDDLEDARAHRGFLAGDFVVLGYSWTADWAVARFTNLATYDFFVRRSFDGGATWDAPRNMTNLPTTEVFIKEPRIVRPPLSPDPAEVQDPEVFFVAWGTEVNQYEHASVGPLPLDIFVTRTDDRGETYAEPVALAATPAGEFECQIKSTPDGRTLFGVWQARDEKGTTTRFRAGRVEPAIPGDLDGDGTVGAVDLFIVLNSWGACADCTECPSDLDGDCTVGAPDLSMVLGAWTAP